MKKPNILAAFIEQAAFIHDQVIKSKDGETHFIQTIQINNDQKIKLIIFFEDRLLHCFYIIVNKEEVKFLREDLENFQHEIRKIAYALRELTITANNMTRHENLPYKPEVEKQKNGVDFYPFPSALEDPLRLFV